MVIFEIYISSDRDEGRQAMGERLSDQQNN
jgi:hypothetical protein